MPIRIFIDQGHNPQGINAGAEGFGYREQDITYDVGIRLADLLRQDDRFAVRTSRNSPDEVLGTSNASSLAARVNAANEWPADYFISIHANASTNSAANGSEIYVYREHSEATVLARIVLAAMVEAAGTKDNGVRLNPSLYVLRRTKMPAMLIELGYITNQEDVERMVNDPQSFADGIYQGLLTYFGLTP